MFQYLWLFWESFFRTPKKIIDLIQIKREAEFVQNGEEDGEYDSYV